MSTQDDSGPAFPAPDAGVADFGQCGAYRGMTLRDYFAAKALMECIRVANDQTPLGGEPRLSTLFDKAAAYAYYAADAMLKARQS